MYLFTLAFYDVYTALGYCNASHVLHGLALITLANSLHFLMKSLLHCWLGFSKCWLYFSFYPLECATRLSGADHSAEVGLC